MPNQECPDFCCPRCGYKTDRKGNIKRHYERKIVCPPILRDIDLTKSVKLAVIQNRSYDESHSIKQPSQSPCANPVSFSSELLFDKPATVIAIQNINNQIINNHQTINQHVNQYNQVFNIVLKMDPIAKASHILDYTNNKLLGCEETLDTCFEKRVRQLNDQTSRVNHVLTNHDLLDCVNQATRINGSVTNFNIVYEKDSRNIKIFHDGQWESYLEESGILRVIEFLRTNYLNDYEFYLLRKIHSGICNSKVLITDRLNVYYSFLSAFDLAPHIEGYTDKYLLGYQIREGNEYSIEHYALSTYKEQKQQMKVKERSHIKKSVSDVIKNNTVQNVKEINLALMDILQMDREYKSKVLNNYLKIVTPSNILTCFDQSLCPNLSITSENI